MNKLDGDGQNLMVSRVAVKIYQWKFGLGKLQALTVMLPKISWTSYPSILVFVFFLIILFFKL